MSKAMIKRMVKETKRELREAARKFIFGEVNIDHVTIIQEQLADLESML